MAGIVPSLLGASGSAGEDAIAVGLNSCKGEIFVPHVCVLMRYRVQGSIDGTGECSRATKTWQSLGGAVLVVSI